MYNITLFWSYVKEIQYKETDLNIGQNWTWINIYFDTEEKSYLTIHCGTPEAAKLLAETLQEFHRKFSEGKES